MGSDKHLAHHFDNRSQQIRAEKIGMWLFLATEVLMFGGLFVGYLIYKGIYPEVFKEGSYFLDWRQGTINTAVLLFSSWTMVLAIYYAQRDKIKKSQIFLAVTLACGFAFMIVKYMEYTHKFHKGIFPGVYFSYQGDHFIEGLPLYFSFYYLMTGLHASHVLIGMFLIAWMLLKTYKKQIHAQNYMPLEYVGLFWHLVDLIWIFLFPLLYLVE